MVIHFSQIFPEYGKSNPSVWNSGLDRFLTIWSHWDSGWYLTIITQGYHLRGPVGEMESNIAFYPLYPYLVKLLSWPVYNLEPKVTVLIAFGVLVSNLFLLGALFFLYKLILHVFADEALAERSILYILVFPTAFFFSCFYTEATYLFFAAAAFYFAMINKWLLACVMAIFVSVARPLGVTIVIPLGLIYLERIHWDLRKIRPDILLLGLGPTALLAHMASLYPITGDLMAIFKTQGAWNKQFSSPWETLVSDGVYYSQGILEIDRVSLVLFLILGLVCLRKLPSLSFGAFPLLILVPVLFTGTVTSATRYALPMFPCFILLAKFGKNPHIHKFILVLFFTLQILFMTAWSRMYWVQ
ncbi:MAG: hypothetical protein GX491_07085 [Chloroflexi bacterium]|nr:hypothetical protein [Chloroflexota bacterium]